MGEVGGFEPLRDGKPMSPSGSPFNIQVACSAVILVAVARFYIDQPFYTNESPMFWGICTLAAASIAVAIVDWESLHRHWRLTIPLLDIVAIVLMEAAEPGVDFTVLLLLPVLWMALLGRMGAIMGPSFSLALVWGSELVDIVRQSDSQSTLDRLMAPIALPFVLCAGAGAMYLVNRRVSAQHILLQRQSKMLEQLLSSTHREERRVRELLDTVDFAVVRTDRKGRITNVNHATRRMFADLGLPAASPPEWLPVYCDDAVTPYAAKLLHLRALDGDFVDNETFWLGHPGERRVALAITTRLLVGMDNTIEGVVLVGRDITAEVNAIRDRDDLVASVSHELRTPLSSVLGYVDLARETPSLDDELRRMLDIAFVNTNRVLALVNDFEIARSREPAQRIGLVLEECDLAGLVAESVESLRPLADERNLTMTLNHVTDAKIRGDSLRLRQVVDNLLSNAIKYNSPGGRVDVVLEDSRDSDGEPALQLRVTDSGRGMTHEEQLGAFEKFYRAERVRGTSVHGVGLGLSISREIIELHGGVIGLTSTSEVGTTVTVCIPRGSKVVANDF